MVLFAPLFLLVCAAAIAGTVFWIMMLVHVATHDNKDKLMWALIVVFTHMIGALIYYFVVVNKPESPAIQNSPKRRA